ncbi:MAG TPA: hypothetical protein PK228_09110, partial [Saprospiraceae bacterium]|nr:hypothetical protein [Saprospiraceae bacterium]
LNISLSSAQRPFSVDEIFWKKLRAALKSISFTNYETFLNGVCGTGVVPDEYNNSSNNLITSRIASRRFLPFTDTDSYRTIKVLTEVFLLVNCAADVQDMDGYSEDILNGNGNRTIPFLNSIRNRLNDLPIKFNSIGDVLTMLAPLNPSQLPNPNPSQLPNPNPTEPNCYGILRDSLTQPCFIELIWSYWHEESMLVQALHAISLRFQNMRAPGRSKDPLAAMEIAPLRPLNNLLWGYLQDEQHRLSVKRRNYEYDHHYGITLQGKAAPPIEAADSRKNFLEGFHVLLHRCSLFYLQDDDLTIKADGFPILNNLREVHFILTEGMHNQYGDLPFTARAEMLTQQWLLARAEFREFLPSRTMVAYPENWMGPLTTMNNLQGWTSISPVNFNTLAVYGELLLLAIRFGHWSDLGKTADDAANWAREFRPEIQGYIHAYQATTGVDLSAKQVNIGKVDAQQPSLHLQKRAKVGANGNGQVGVGF